MLVGDEVFIKGIVQGIESGEFVYRSGDLIWGKGQPGASIKIDENSYVYTAEYADDNDIWPPKAPATPSPGDGSGETTDPGAGATGGSGAGAPAGTGTAWVLRPRNRQRQELLSRKGP
jgi:hypothetical protein